jgi:hypothetical protein
VAPKVVEAATITVTIKAESAADGNCALREAIINANADNQSGSTDCAAGNGSDTINFNISGTADFINGGQNGYSIRPTSALPNITSTLTINGYTQPGAIANTAVSPRPFNGILLIEIDGTNAGGSADGFSAVGNNIAFRGLVINRFGFRAIGPNGGGSGTTIQGCYIGTDPTGLIDRGNANTGIQTGPSTMIGGLDPEDRNIISGNDGGGGSPNTGDHNWTIQGNYIGLGADGKTTISNSPVGGNGALSIDNSDGHLVGGTQTGAANVISGNRSFGIFPDNNDNVTIQGNIIGPDWEGKPLVNNPQLGGIGLPPLSGDMTNFLIGGATSGAGNTITHNNGPGVIVLNASNGATPLGASNNISILGNSIYGNRANNSYSLSVAGLGIDLARLNSAGFVLSDMGVNANDEGDGDTGPNNYLNYPVIFSATSSGGKVSITYSLDINNAESGATGYRVEFFANESASASGYGEGQVFIGAETISGDVSNRTVILALPAGYNIDNVTATATTTDASIDGFGHTSEFGPAIKMANPALPATGDNSRIFLVAALVSWVLAVVGLAAATGFTKCKRFLL